VEPRTGNWFPPSSLIFEAILKMADPFTCGPLLTRRVRPSTGPQTDVYLCPLHLGPDGVTAHIAHDRAGLFWQVHFDRSWISSLTAAPTHGG
jgi:hypothetical protein